MVIDHTGAEPVAQQGQCRKVTEIPAHRVIIASRCDWFRRALLSGMRESIEQWVVMTMIDHVLCLV